jgi:uncharacterized OB-fold protein
MSDWIPPEPARSSETAPYWQATQQHKLILPRCCACGRTHFYPRGVCPFCYSTDLDWIEASGKGTIYAFSHMKVGDPPYVMAFVTLAEGPTMMTNIVESDPEVLAIGDNVELTFLSSEGETSYPVFRKLA